MIRIWRFLAACLLMSSLVLLPAFAMAADFELFWDPNCNTDADLEGYFIYYNQDASVAADPGGAIDLYVALTEIGFDPANPSLLIEGLSHDVRYCFAVTAWYGDEESDLSNEVCGINGAYALDPDPDPDPDPDSDSDPDSDPTAAPSPGLNPAAGGSESGSGSSGGCFIGSLK